MFRVKRQKGAALIMALLLVAIVSAIATGLFYRQRILVQSATAQSFSTQAYADANYAVFWAQKRLQQRYQANKKQQQLAIIWPLQLTKTVLRSGNQITATLTPANGLFNINNLAQGVSAYLTTFAQLIQQVDANIDSNTAKNIALSTQQFMLPPQKGNVQVDPYQKAVPPYRASQHMMSSASEVRLVSGMTKTLYLALRPYLIALPNKNVPINVNAAPKMIMAALLNNQSAAQDVISERNQQQGFSSTDKFLSLPVVQDNQMKDNPLDKQITTKFPQYYLLRVMVKHGKLKYNVVSLLQYSGDKPSMIRLRQGQNL